MYSPFRRVFFLFVYLGEILKEESFKSFKLLVLWMFALLLFYICVYYFLSSAASLKLLREKVSEVLACQQFVYMPVFKLSGSFDMADCTVLLNSFSRVTDFFFFTNCLLSIHCLQAFLCFFSSCLFHVSVYEH